MKKASELVREDCRNVVAPLVQKLAPLKGTTLAVTGGTGFLGSWLAELVACLNDEHSFGMECSLVARNIDVMKTQAPHLLERKDLTYVRGDVRYLSELPRATSWVVHAAGSPDVRTHSTSPVDTMSVIGEGTSNLLRVAARCSELQKILYVSSGLVYGEQPLSLEKIPEDWRGAPPSGDPTSAYAEAKRFAETLCAAARTQLHLPLITVRPFAFLGPYQSLETPWAINNFLRDAVCDQPIRVLGNGQTVRSYMYGADLAAWILATLLLGKSGQVLNIGSDEATTIEATARLVAQCCRQQPDVVLGSALHRFPHVSRFVPSTQAAQKEFGLTLSFPLKMAIERTLAWHALSRAQR